MTRSLPARQKLRRFGQGAYPVLLLLAIAGAAELLVVFAVVRPLSIANHQAPADFGVPLPLFLGRSVTGLLHYLTISAVAFALYIIGYITARRCTGKPALCMVLVGSAIFGCTLLATYPAGSADVFTNILDGRMRWIYGLNPLVYAPNSVASDPLFGHLVWQNEPTYYGPVWYWLLLVPTRLARRDITGSLVAFRLITLPFLIGSSYLAARIASLRAPRLAPAAALLVGWCPLLLWETGVNGHNDIVMAFFAIFALERALNGNWRVAIPLLAVSVLTKYVTAILAPFFIIAALRDSGNRGRRDCAIGLSLSLLLGIAVWIPFWNGLSPLVSLLGNGSQSLGLRLANSPSYVLALAAEHLSSGSQASLAVVGGYVKVGTLAVFLTAYLVVIKGSWTRRVSLSMATFRATFLYLVLISWWFWPWYLTLLVVLGSTLVAGEQVVLPMLFSGAALFGYAILGWVPVLVHTDVDRTASATFCVAVFSPVLLLLLIRHTILRRNRPEHSAEPGVL